MNGKQAAAASLACVSLCTTCLDNPLPPRDQVMAAASWKVPQPDRLRCSVGAENRVRTDGTALAGGSSGLGGHPASRGPPPPCQDDHGGTPAGLLHAGREPVAGDLGWSLCLLPDRCPQVVRGDTTVVRYEDIAGWTAGDPEAVLYAWRLLPALDGTFRPDKVRAVILELRSANPLDPWP